MADAKRGRRRKALGLACLCVAIALLYSAEWSGKSYFPVESENVAVLASEALNVAAYAACALLWRPFERVFAKPGRAQVAALLAVGAASTLGRALLAAAGGGGTLGPLAVAGVALHSLGDPVLLLACLCLLCRGRPRRAAAVLPCSFLVSGLAMTIQQAANIHLGSAFAIAGPLLAALLFLACVRLSAPAPLPRTSARAGEDDAPVSQESAPPTRRATPLPLWPFVLMVAYDLVYHLVITVDTTSSPYGMVGLVLLSAAALALALVKGNDYSPLPLNKTALPCVVAALMCLTLAWPGPDVAALLSNTGSAAFYLFALITFIMMCQRHEFDAARSLGAFLAVEHVGHFLGDLAGQLFLQAFPAGDAPLDLFATVIATAMVIVVTLFMNDLEVARIFGLVPEGLLARRRVGPGADGASKGDAGAAEAGASVVSVMSTRESVAWQCARAARVHGLTVREEEVLELMMLDLSNAQIADAMTVAPGTVKTHVSHICRKLGASSRAEAIEAARRA